MDATELMVGSVVVGAFRENCYIVGSKQTGEAICVDPGDDVDEIKALARDLKLKITKMPTLSSAQASLLRAIVPPSSAHARNL